jgi:hypothetical protein
MALQKIIEIEGQSIVKTSIGDIENGRQKVLFFAYITVATITGSKNEISAQVNFKGDGVQFNKQYKFEPSVSENSLNFIAQTYDYLKTLQEFAGAENC